MTSRGEQTESNSYENRFLPHSSSFFLLRHQPPQIRQMAAPKFGKVAVHNFPLSYYYKVATASFVCGAAVEAFMIHTCVRMKIQKSPNLLIILTFLSLFLSFFLFSSLSLSLSLDKHSGFYEKVTQIEANRRADFSTEVSKR